MVTGTMLDPMAAGVVALTVQPLLRAGEKIRAIIPEDHSQRRLHVVTQQRCLAFDRRRQTIASEFAVRTVVRAELGQDGFGHRADIESVEGRFTELRVTSAQDARALGTAIVRACDEALHDVETLVPTEMADASAHRMLSSGQSEWSVTVTRQEVRARDVSGVLRVLAPLLTSPPLTRRAVEAVSLNVTGYEDRGQPLWEITEVRTFLQHLDAQFPYWFLFLDKHGPGLLDVVRGALAVDFAADRLGERLTGWWMPALRRIAEFAELDEDVTDILVARSLSYLRGGPGEPVTPTLPRLVYDEPDDDIEPLDAGEVMGDLSVLLEELPATWHPGPENDLVVFLWSVLKEKGLVRTRSQVEHVRGVASVLALHKLRSRFHQQAFGAYGGPDDEAGYSVPAAGLVGSYPRAEPFWIGVHAGADATYDAPLDPLAALDPSDPLGTRTGTPWVADALAELARNQYDEVVPALRRTLGENALFAALLASSTADARYPIPDAVVDELRSTDLDGALGEAWAWLREQGR
ncbi:hypothetical protein [Kineosporia succinea]|uniref:Uncharacterized protein n=1 Tax=Kineosporia succinea TaxID=84632 RepID=A0ABT9PF91_9ACTN|nr:hypothetical protein [Kineosporia succinea]MDP9831151.1 hypothetical protein [Kineosporia succinea]